MVVFTCCEERCNFESRVCILYSEVKRHGSDLWMTLVLLPRDRFILPLVDHLSVLQRPRDEYRSCAKDWCAQLPRTRNVSREWSGVTEHVDVGTIRPFKDLTRFQT